MRVSGRSYSEAMALVGSSMSEPCHAVRDQVSASVSSLRLGASLHSGDRLPSLAHRQSRPLATLHESTLTLGLVSLSLSLGLFECSVAGNSVDSVFLTRSIMRVTCQTALLPPQGTNSSFPRASGLTLPQRSRILLQASVSLWNVPCLNAWCHTLPLAYSHRVHVSGFCLLVREGQLCGSVPYARQ